jgi:hypothetical protein
MLDVPVMGAKHKAWPAAEYILNGRYIPPIFCWFDLEVKIKILE